MKKIRVIQKGQHFLTLDQELEVKKQSRDGKVWVDGIQNGTKRKMIEQILWPDEFEIIE